jgi:hypothetical protein
MTITERELEELNIDLLYSNKTTEWSIYCYILDVAYRRVNDLLTEKQIIDKLLINYLRVPYKSKDLPLIKETIIPYFIKEIKEVIKEEHKSLDPKFYAKNEELLIIKVLRIFFDRTVLERVINPCENQ